MFKIFVVRTLIAIISTSTHQQNAKQSIPVHVEQILRVIPNESRDEQISRLNAAALKVSDVEVENIDALQEDFINSKILKLPLLQKLNKFTTPTTAPTTSVTDTTIATTTTATTTTTTTTPPPIPTGRDNLDNI